MMEHDCAPLGLDVGHAVRTKILSPVPFEATLTAHGNKSTSRRADINLLVGEKLRTAINLLVGEKLRTAINLLVGEKCFFCEIENNFFHLSNDGTG
jgi:hypothetical protein